MDYNWSQNQGCDLEAFGLSVPVLSEIKLKFHITGLLHFINILFSNNKNQFLPLYLKRINLNKQKNLSAKIASAYSEQLQDAQVLQYKRNKRYACNDKSLSYNTSRFQMGITGSCFHKKN